MDAELTLHSVAHACQTSFLPPLVAAISPRVGISSMCFVPGLYHSEFWSRVIFSWVLLITRVRESRQYPLARVRFMTYKKDWLMKKTPWKSPRTKHMDEMPTKKEMAAVSPDIWRCAWVSSVRIMWLLHLIFFFFWHKLCPWVFVISMYLVHESPYPVDKETLRG